MRRLLLGLWTALLLLASGQSQAFYHDFGVLGNPDLKASPSVTVPPCIVCGVDQFDFALAAPAVFSASAFNVTPYVAFPVYAIGGFTAVLVPGGVPPVPPALVPGIPFLASPDGQHLDLLPAMTLAAGNYSILVTGLTGPLGSAYAVSVATLPVPEPEMFAMLLAGLGLVGAIARRRRN